MLHMLLRAERYVWEVEAARSCRKRSDTIQPISCGTVGGRKLLRLCDLQKRRYDLQAELYVDHVLFSQAAFRSWIAQISRMGEEVNGSHLARPEESSSSIQLSFGRRRSDCV